VLALLSTYWKKKHPNLFHLNLASKFAGFEPVDYSMRGILQQNVNETCIADLDDLKHRLRMEWAKLDHVIIAAAIRQWRRRLSVCVRAGGGHFEHCF